jgi:hypothetical protein
VRIRETPMTDDIRGHDPRPTDEERAWLETDLFAASRRIAILLILAFAVAGYLGYAMDDKPNLVAARHGG